MITGNDLQDYRKSRGWSRADCADVYGVNHMTIRRWEVVGIPEHGPARKLIERDVVPFVFEKLKASQ